MRTGPLRLESPGKVRSTLSLPSPGYQVLLPSCVLGKISFSCHFWSHFPYPFSFLLFSLGQPVCLTYENVETLNKHAPMVKLMTSGPDNFNTAARVAFDFLCTEHCEWRRERREKKTSQFRAKV